MNETRPLTGDMHKENVPLNLAEYRKAGGYEPLRKMLAEMEPGDVTSVVKDSGLQGRGGAGFPTGVKWSFVPVGGDAPKKKYLICNADEMEPGAFKDRYLMERNPHMLIEGMICAAYAIQAPTGYIFLRNHYHLARERLEKALEEARDAGYLGKSVGGSDFTFDIHVHVSAGRYICGEETALISALEGARPIPRAKPPFPGVSGLFGKPTVVNNVETICNVPHIILHGAQWFKGLSKTDQGGTKIFGVSGRVKRPGAFELPMGTTLREVIYEHAGGMSDGYEFRGVLPGGGSTDFLVAEHLDLPMDYQNIQNAGSRFGTATMIILDDRTCPVGFVANLTRFFGQESCGWCTPCREGIPWMARILYAIDRGEGGPEQISILKEHTHKIWIGKTYCALAPGAMEPLQSALKYFGDDFERHIRERKCPWG